ncbi:F-box domain-containing protein [Dendryphion nanum]|uniref:F-box domain-containing protein n=1 Tax=Dendryphion nanum TaxID=256645 RepID=A0A9P9EJD2_9PLEO|nr:F-box domain-containing protein [Dendryphion nanum]
MESSPLFVPGTPTSRSPSPFADDVDDAVLGFHDDAQTFSAAEEADGDSDGHIGARETAALTPDETVARSLKGKEKARNGPLCFLDLPVDIIKEIIHQLPHTNDLTSLALCHSALHRLTIPCIYSRFDIVWPDESTHAEPRSGVDALTYGLATLVMGMDSFPHQVRRYNDQTSTQKSPTTPYPIARRRFGNYYAQFTKKFSIGNGPAAWVQEYMIAKEGGKMLGTLVALALARMINLETFVWDMPTGVLRDVWLALSSLADRTDDDDCRLERLWIRWHDNTTDIPAPLPAPPMNLINVPPPPNATHPSGVGTIQAPVVVPAPYLPQISSAIDRVEHPTFSVIPALKSLSVLDIDELPYLDEMSILLARSQHKLRELRVGIAPHAQQRDWVTAWDGDGAQQVDYSTSSTAASNISEKRLGGVLGILVGRIHNLRQTDEVQSRHLRTSELADRLANVKIDDPPVSPAQASLHDREPDLLEHADSSLDNGVVPGTFGFANSIQAPAMNTFPGSNTNHIMGAPFASSSERESQQTSSKSKDTPETNPVPVLNGKLRLDVLELERVPLSVSVLLKAFDWSMLTTLTLLHCTNHEQLWKSLRRTYTPRTSYPGGSPSSSKAYKASYTLRSEYNLNLKKIHTNTVSPSLISFLKETLAPNTLEVLFLQEGRSYSSTVTVDAIYRGPLRRHRSSLKKLMIDSSERGQDGHATTNLRWRRWMLNREIITFITSGRMNSLRELAVSIDYKDWHHFLQRLPLIPHIRSLYIPFIADHAHGNNIDPRELAMQILDIVHLRPEIEMCYMGISTKCFEILENRPSNYDLRHDTLSGLDGPPGGIGGGYGTHDPLMSDEESEATEDDDDDDFDNGMNGAGGGDETDSEASDDPHDESDDDSFVQDDRKGTKFRIREILYYEERISVYKARHGVLKP